MANYYYYLCIFCAFVQVCHNFLSVWDYLTGLDDNLPINARTFVLVYPRVTQARLCLAQTGPESVILPFSGSYYSGPPKGAFVSE